MMNLANICIITTNHSPLDDRIFYKEARTLENGGYKITILAPLTEDGYLVDMGNTKFAKHQSNIQNINIIGFNSPKPNKIFHVKRLLNLRHFTKSRMAKDPYLDLIEKGVELNADIYHCHDIWSLYVCIRIKVKLKSMGKRPKLIYDVHEFTPAATTAGIKNHIFRWISRRIITRFEEQGLKYLDYTITANYLTRQYLLSKERSIQIEVLMNTPPLYIFKDFDRLNADDDKFIICHEGSLVFNRGLRGMVEVIRNLDQKYPNKIQLLIIGDVFGEERIFLENKMKEFHLQDAIKCTGWLPYEDVGEAISQADVGLILMEKTENNMFAGPPNKLFNYMRYGLPIISVDLPETVKIIKETGCGLIVENRNVENISGSISLLIDDDEKRHMMGMKGKEAALSKYNWEIEGRKLIHLYKKLNDMAK